MCLRKTRRFYLMGLLAILFVCASSQPDLHPHPIAQETPAKLQITDVDHSAFPDVTVTLRATDAVGRPIHELQANDLVLYEDDVAVDHETLTEGQDGAIELIYIFDLGRYANYTGFGLDLVRGAATYPIRNNLIRSGIDQISIRARANDGRQGRTITLLDPTLDFNQALNFVASMNFPPSSAPTQGLQAIEDLLLELSARDGPPAFNSAVIFFTNVIETPAPAEALEQARRIAALANQINIPIFSFQTNLQGDNAETLQLLAEETAGEYLLLSRQGGQDEALEQLYRSILERRSLYRLTFRSASASVEPRLLTIRVAGSASVSDSAGFSYHVNLVAPEVVLNAPQDGMTYTIEAERDSEGEWLIPTQTLQIEAQITDWPDEFERNIAQATLIVDGVIETTYEPDPGENRLRFEWNVEDLETEATRSLRLAIQIDDELGLQATSETVEVTYIPTIPPSFFESCRQNPQTSACLAAYIGLLVLILGLLSIPALLVGVWFIRRRARQRQALQGPTPTHTLVVSAQEPSAGGQTLARLQVVAGPSQHIGRMIELRQNEVNLGRDPQQSDVVFEMNASSLSGLHCKLQMIANKFYLVDLHSTNGSRVNGRRITPEQPYNLLDGDEITLGDLKYNGLKLRYIAPPDPMAYDIAEATQQEPGLLTDMGFQTRAETKREDQDTSKLDSD